jgi:serine/threonine-protein kinase
VIGEVIGDYRIFAPLAAPHGGLGSVFVGEHRELGTKAAVEVLPIELMQHAGPVQKFLHTERVIGRLRHASALRLEDAGLDATGRAYVVRELIDSDTLDERIKSLGRLSLTQISEIVRQIANLLAALHDESLVHGELRPAIVLMVPQGGLARGEPVKVTQLATAALKRAAGIPIAPTYMAPELFGAAAATDWRSDAYGLGCVAFEMATGRPPFLGATDDEVRHKHLEAVPPAARSLMPDVAPSLDIMIGRLLSKQPADRFGSMREIARAFEQLGGAARTSPLAPTANELPAYVAGEVAARGEIQAKVAVEPSSGIPTESIIAPTGSTRIDPGAFTPPSAHAPRDSTMSIPKTGGNRVLIAIAIAIAAAIVVIVALRG